MAKVLVICGATASGKTSLSVACAKAFNGEIISADSLLVYKGLNIGTAKPTLDEREGIPHYMIDVVEPTQSFSVSDYEEMALPIVEKLLLEGKTPIICGGTGFYINSLLYKSQFGNVGANEALRAEYEKLADEKGKEYVYSILCEKDAESAKKLHYNDLKRVIRALEIYDATGKPKSYFDRLSRLGNSEIMVGMITLDFHNRENLYGRVDERVDAMIEEGLVEEVKSLYERGLLEKHTTAAQAIGYKEIISYLDGEATLNEAVEELKLSTRRYAKRQLTWFRHEKDAYRLYLDDERGRMRDKADVIKEAAQAAQQILKGFSNESNRT